MRSKLIALNPRLTSDAFDSRVGQVFISLAGLAVIPLAAVAIVKHPGSGTESLLGAGLSALMLLLCLMLGMLCGGIGEFGRKVPMRSHWPEFVSYVICIGILIAGVNSVAELGLTQLQVTIGVLLSGTLSIAVLVLGMMTTVVAALRS